MPSDSADQLRAAVAARPDDWAAALALKAALARLGCYAEGDPVFQAARRRFPDAVWAAHMAGLYAFPQGELPALAVRARTLAGAAPGDPALARLLGDMLRQARDYAGAGAAYARDPRPGARELEAQMRLSEQLAIRLADLPPDASPSGPPGEPRPAIAVINLDRNTGRLADMDTHFASCRPSRFRVPGIEGGRLTAPAIARLGGDPAMRGTLGCFLSHAAAWEAMLGRGLEHCLVVEDDVIPLFDLPAGWGVFGLPDRFDLCFVNDRLAPLPEEPSFRAYTLAKAMLAFPAWRNAPGADGYLLSAAGARKLLHWVGRDGFGGDVDWRLLAYGLSPEACDALPADSHARWALSQLPPVSGAERLAAYTLSPPLIRTVPLASDREDENRTGAGFPPPAEAHS